MAQYNSICWAISFSLFKNNFILILGFPDATRWPFYTQIIS